jgi:membrane-bound lytic murein transglycosylase A
MINVVKLSRRCVVVAIAVLTLLSCTQKPKPPQLALTPVSFSDLPGWQDDKHAAALTALIRSCEKPIAMTAPVEVTATDWSGPCAAARNLSADNDGAARQFFETWFLPFRVSDGTKEDGLFTGYFEAELHGARQADSQYSVPLYRLPDDHVAVDLSQFDTKLRGKHIVGRVENGKLRPYHPRGVIDKGALANSGMELLWVDDLIDAFVLHVQGSGRVILADGSVVRVGFAGHNGLGYRSIGRALIERGVLQPGGASWNDIRNWIEQNPDQAADLLAVNERFIFFRELTGDGPIGAAGVALTPGRSLAVDKRFVPYGLPIWLDTNWPNDLARPLRRLMVAQDTGAAIRGPIRGDFFWGYGPDALAFAGKMKSRGRYFLLLPRTAAARMAGS